MLDIKENVWLYRSIQVLNIIQDDKRRRNLHERTGSCNRKLIWDGNWRCVRGTIFRSQDYIAEKWGWIDTFYPPEKGHIFHDGLKAGEYTDDTEQAMALMKSFIRNKKVDSHDVVNEILAWAERVKDKYASPLGPSTERALKAINDGADINVSGRYGNTNGSAMRISPVGIIHGLINL